MSAARGSWQSALTCSGNKCSEMVKGETQQDWEQGVHLAQVVQLHVELPHPLLYVPHWAAAVCGTSVVQAGAAAHEICLIGCLLPSGFSVDLAASQLQQSQPCRPYACSFTDLPTDSSRTCLGSTSPRDSDALIMLGLHPQKHGGSCDRGRTVDAPLRGVCGGLHGASERDRRWSSADGVISETAHASC